MKRELIVSLFVVLVATTAFSQTGTVRELTGEVEIKPAGASAFTPVRAGDQIARDTIVSTGFRSTAVIVVGSSVITVRPLTRLSLSEIVSTAESENISVQLQTGRIRVDVRPPAGIRANATVQSPSATASVRGTSFEMDTHNLSVIEGRVVYQGFDGLGVPVIAGDSSASVSITAQDPVEIASAELLPPAPVGTSVGGEEITTIGIITPSTVDIDIGFDWGN